MADVVLENVTKKFGNHTALDNVSLTIPNGSFVVLLGPTGAGKTTTLRMVSGLDRPDSGNIYFGGHSVEGHSPAQRNVAMVFQQYSLYPHLTVRQNLEFPLKSPLLKTPRDAIDRKVNAIAEVLQISTNSTTRRRRSRAAKCSVSRLAARSFARRRSISWTSL